MMSSVIGGAMLPHAPQFSTMPETEDRDTVERVKTAAAEIGTRLRALRPDLWIIFANDHVEQFFHTAAPPFTIHVGAEAKGEFAGRRFHWRVPGEIGLEIVRQMYAQGFDPAFTGVAKIGYALGIPLTHLEIADPVQRLQHLFRQLCRFAQYRLAHVCRGVAEARQIVVAIDLEHIVEQEGHIFHGGFVDGHRRLRQEG